MHLTKPTPKYEHSWKEALKEFEAEARIGFWNIPEKPTDLNEYITRTDAHSRGENIPKNWMPATTYWLIDNDEFVGHVNIRHTLLEWSKKRGGHIGFAIRPSARQKGYGAKILTLALPKAKEIGLQKVLITCDDSNVASQKIIEKQNGHLQDVIEVESEKIRRYWINL